VVEALGGLGLVVGSAGELRPAFDKARSSAQPALVNVHIAESMRASSTYSA
jgi:thiamine pyrophosphate-dependent acetolactate synthase large subunit-like protein